MQELQKHLWDAPDSALATWLSKGTLAQLAGLWGQEGHNLKAAKSSAPLVQLSWRLFSGCMEQVLMERGWMLPRR